MGNQEIDKPHTADVVRAIFGDSETTQGSIQTSLSDIHHWRGASDTRYLTQALGREPRRPEYPSQSAKSAGSRVITYLTSFPQELDQATRRLHQDRRREEGQPKGNEYLALKILQDNPHLTAATSSLLTRIEQGDPAAIEVALCLDHFLVWMSRRPHCFHFGPRQVGTYSYEKTVVTGSELDNLVAVFKTRLSFSEMLHLEKLESLRVASSATAKKTGLSAREILGHLLHSPSLTSIIQRIEVQEFKLGSPPGVGKAHKDEAQLTKNLNLLWTLITQKTDDILPFEALLTKPDQVSPPDQTPPTTSIPIIGKLVYFTADGVQITTYQPEILKLDEEAVAAARQRKDTSQAIPQYGGQVGRAIRRVRQHTDPIPAPKDPAHPEVGQLTLDQVTDIPFLQIEDPYGSTREMIEQLHQRESVSLETLVIIAGQINTLLEYEDKTLVIPLVEVVGEDARLLIPPRPEQAEARLYRGSELQHTMPILDVNAQTVNQPLVARALRGATMPLPDVNRLPFTFTEINLGEAEKILLRLQRRYMDNLRSSEARPAQVAREYLVTNRGIPLDLANYYCVGCTVDWKEDLATCGLDRNEDLETLLQTGIVSGSIFASNKLVIPGWFLTFPLHEPLSLIINGEWRLNGIAARAPKPELSRSKRHRSVIPPQVKQNEERYALFIGNPLEADVVVMTEGPFSALSLRALFQEHARRLPRPCVIANVGFGHTGYLERLKFRRLGIRIYEAYDRGEWADKARAKIAGVEPLWPLITQVLPDLPPSVKDPNDLWLHLLEQDDPELMKELAGTIQGA